MEQVLNIIIPIAVLVIGWWCSQIWSQNKDNADKIAELRVQMKDYRTREESDHMMEIISTKIEKLASLEVLLAQSYVTKAELKELFEQVIVRLNRIEDR